MSYWDAYMLPVAIRKYMIKRYNDIVEQRDHEANQNNHAGDVGRKLSDFETKLQQRQETLSSTPKDYQQRDMSSFMKPIR